LHLLIQSFFYESQHCGVEQHRPYIEEVAVYHTGSQQYQHGDKSEHLFARKVVQEQPECLNAVEKIGCKANHTAGCQHLQDGVVPSGREKGYKFRRCGPGVDRFVHRVEGCTENGIIQELLPSGGVVLVTLAGLEAASDQIPEQPQELVVIQDKNSRDHQRGEYMNGDIGPGAAAVEQGDGVGSQIRNDTHHHGAPGTGKQHASKEQQAGDVEQTGVPALSRQEEGEGDHHGQQCADIIVMAPAGIDQSAFDDAVLNDTVAEIYEDQFRQQNIPHAHSCPGQISGRRFIPFDQACKQNIKNDDRCSLDKGKQQISVSDFHELRAAQSGEQVAGAKGQYAGQQHPFTLPKGGAPQFRIPDQTIDKTRDEQYRKNDHIQAAIGKSKQGIVAESRIAAAGWGKIGADGQGHDGKQIPTAKAQVQKQKNKTGICEKFGAENIGKYGQCPAQEQISGFIEEIIEGTQIRRFIQHVHCIISFPRLKKYIFWLSYHILSFVSMKHSVTVGGGVIFAP